MLCDVSISGATWPCNYFLRRGLASCLRLTRHSQGYPCCQGRWAPFLYFGRSGALLGYCHAHLFYQDRAFFLPRPVDNRFHSIDVQRDPAIPSSILPTPPVSSPCLDANEGIDLHATRSPGCWSLHLCQTNQMWGGELLELLVVEGYRITVRAKPLHVVDETFCSIPTDGANCCYLDRLTLRASVMRN